jgi:hypothetical protein
MGFSQNHVDPALEEGFGDRIVEPRWCGNDDRVDPVGPCRLPFRHLAVVGVDTVRSEQLAPCGCPRDLGIDRHGAGHQLA